MLADIEALDNVGELIGMFAGDAKLAENDSLSLPVGPEYCATFVAIGAKIVRRSDGDSDWSKVQRLKLLSISRRQ